jgi:hypothetical protein
MDTINPINSPSLEKKLTSYKFLNICLVIGFIYLIASILIFVVFPKKVFNKSGVSESKKKSQETSESIKDWFNKSSQTTKAGFIAIFALIIGGIYWFGGTIVQGITGLFINPVVSLVLTIIGIIVSFFTFYFGSETSGIAAIVGFVVFLLFFSISGFIYIKRKNEDDTILNSYPKSVQDIFNLRTNYTFILFLFILLTTLLYLLNPWGIMTDYGGPVIFFTLFVGIVCGILITIYQKFLANPFSNSSSKIDQIPSGLAFLGKGLYILIALGTSAGLIFGALKLMGVFEQDASRPESWGHIIFNLLLFCGMLGILYKLANAGGFLDKNPLYRLILNTLLYIPCLLVSVINYIVQLFGIASALTPPKPFEIKMLVLGLILSSGYFLWVFLLGPFLKTKYLKQGGKQIINQPISTDVLTNVASYQTLNGSDQFDYRYAMSFWIYIDSFPPSTNSSYTKVVPILSYGENPAVKYSSETNTLFITIKKSQDTENISKPVVEEGFTLESVEKWKNNITDSIEKVKTMAFNYDVDADGNRIIYKHPDVLLQKWNHIVLNYSGGTLDVFYNGKLVKSEIEVAPYIKYDNLTIGQENGIKGSIANLMYFKMPLDILTIHTLYASLKDKNPPTISENPEKLVPITK